MKKTFSVVTFFLFSIWSFSRCWLRKARNVEQETRTSGHEDKEKFQSKKKTFCLLR